MISLFIIHADWRCVASCANELNGLDCVPKHSPVNEWSTYKSESPSYTVSILLANTLSTFNSVHCFLLDNHANTSSVAESLILNPLLSIWVYVPASLCFTLTPSWSIDVTMDLTSLGCWVHSVSTVPFFNDILLNEIFLEDISEYMKNLPYNASFTLLVLKWT